MYIYIHICIYIYIYICIHILKSRHLFLKELYFGFFETFEDWIYDLVLANLSLQRLGRNRSITCWEINVLFLIYIDIFVHDIQSLYTYIYCTYIYIYVYIYIYICRTCILMQDMFKNNLQQFIVCRNHFSEIWKYNRFEIFFETVFANQF